MFRTIKSRTRIELLLLLLLDEKKEGSLKNRMRFNLVVVIEEIRNKEKMYPNRNENESEKRQRSQTLKI